MPNCTNSEHTLYSKHGNDSTLCSASFFVAFLLFFFLFFYLFYTATTFVVFLAEARMYRASGRECTTITGWSSLSLIVVSVVGCRRRSCGRDRLQLVIAPRGVIATRVVVHKPSSQHRQLLLSVACTRVVGNVEGGSLLLRGIHHHGHRRSDWRLDEIRCPTNLVGEVGRLGHYCRWRRSVLLHVFEWFVRLLTEMTKGSFCTFSNSGRRLASEFTSKNSFFCRPTAVLVAALLRHSSSDGRSLFLQPRTLASSCATPTPCAYTLAMAPIAR